MTDVPPGGLFRYPPGELAFYGLAHVLGANVFRVDEFRGNFRPASYAALAPLIGSGLAALAMVRGSGRRRHLPLDRRSNDTAASFSRSWVSSRSRGRLRIAPAASRRRSGGRPQSLRLGRRVKEYAIPDRRVRRTLSVAGRCGARAALDRRRNRNRPGAFVLLVLGRDPPAFVKRRSGALLVHQDMWGGTDLARRAELRRPGARRRARAVHSGDHAARLRGGRRRVLAPSRRRSRNGISPEVCAASRSRSFRSLDDERVLYFLTPLAMAGVVLALRGRTRRSPARSDRPPLRRPLVVRGS